MTTEQFDKYCRGLSNGNQGIKLMQKNFKLLNELNDKKEMIKKDALKLKTDMNESNERMHARVIECILKNDKKYLANLKGNNYFKQFLEEPPLIDLSSDCNTDEFHQQKNEEQEQTKTDDVNGELSQENGNKELISIISDDNNNNSEIPNE